MGALAVRRILDAMVEVEEAYAERGEESQIGCKIRGYAQCHPNPSPPIQPFSPNLSPVSTFSSSYTLLYRHNSVEWYSLRAWSLVGARVYGLEGTDRNHSYTGVEIQIRVIAYRSLRVISGR